MIKIGQKSFPYPEYTDILSPAYNERKNGGYQKILVMHYSAGTLERAMKLLASPEAKVSSHYVVSDQKVSDQKKKIFRLVKENKRAWHAGRGSWGPFKDVNSSSIGIEIVNVGYTYGLREKQPPLYEKKSDFLKLLNKVNRYSWSYHMRFLRKCGEKGWIKGKKWQPYPKFQINTLIELSKAIIFKNNIKPQNVIGHSDLAPQRKIDPGPLFPWQRLSEEGIGLWPKKNITYHHFKEPTNAGIPWFQKHARIYGYGIKENGHLDPETKKVVSAFQMHFRQNNYDGKVDIESCKILCNLLNQVKIA